MKLLEIAEPKLKIFLDLDGVVADFERGKREILGLSDSTPEDETFAIMASEKGSGFYAKLKKMKDADQLWAFLKNTDVEILSAIPKPRRKVKVADPDKRDWVKKNLSPSVKVNITQGGSAKKRMAAPDRILIDDLKRNIDQWRSSGGIGILHTSASKTIRVLKTLGF